MTEAHVEILKQIADQGNTGYVTAEDGAALSNEGMIVVNQEHTHPDNPQAFYCQITQAGIDALNQPAPTAPVAPETPATPAAPQADTKFEIQSGVEIPAVKRGGGTNLKPRSSTYPFEQLEIGQSFHVAVSEENKEPWKKMASNVSAANRRSMKEVEPQELVKVSSRKLRKDENGNAVVGADGKKVYDKVENTVPKTVPTKKFIARRVSGGGENPDPNGDGCRVYRVPLDFAG